MKNHRIIMISLIALLGSLLVLPAQSQVREKVFNEIDKKQQAIESLFEEVYQFIDKYPNVKYSYVFDQGNISEVKIDGIPNRFDKMQLKSCLISLERLKSKIVNQPNSLGIYYVAEKEPEPKMGYREFYNDLHKNLSYPDMAKDNGVEGTIFVKFIVDSQGKIGKVVTTENIDTPFEMAIDDLKMEAVEAIRATSGEWTPAKVGDVPVDQWVALPVQFNLERNHYSLFN